MAKQTRTNGILVFAWFLKIFPTMYSDDDIDSAVVAGVLTEEAAREFRTHVATLKNTPVVDEEHFRLVTGFNDIFVSIACLLLLISVSWIGSEIKEWLGGLATAGTAWVLSEFFVRKRRMALPAILLLLSFVGGVFVACTLFNDAPSHINFVVGGILAAGAAWLHWQRFQVPITVAAGTAAAVISIVFVLVIAFPEIASSEAEQWIWFISFVAGVVVFLLAMRWDATDTMRQTRRSDVAFWLHLLAAPLLVHPVFASLSIFNRSAFSWVEALTVTALYILIALISLCVDRRALMVSALGYVLFVFSALLKQFGLISLNFALTAFIIGASLLLLSVFWRSCRAFVLKLFPPRILRHLPPC